jgi:hypothetical protein
MPNFHTARALSNAEGWSPFCSGGALKDPSFRLEVAILEMVDTDAQARIPRRILMAYLAILTAKVFGHAQSLRMLAYRMHGMSGKWRCTQVIARFCINFGAYFESDPWFRRSNGQNEELRGAHWLMVPVFPPCEHIAIEKSRGSVVSLAR